MKNILAVAAILACASVSSAGQITLGGATWNFPDAVLGLETEITVDATTVALLQTKALDGAELRLTQQAVPFSTPQAGPGDAVGEFMTVDFVTGQEVIAITAPSDGTYTFQAESQIVGEDALAGAFQIRFGIPEPASMGLLSIAGLFGFRRRR